MQNKYTNNTPLIDLLFGTLLVFGALFLISFLLIAPDEDSKKVDVAADILITMTWPLDINDDIDLYVEDPNGAIVYFQRREDGLMHLDRDDLGNSNDRVITPYGDTIEYKENREIVTLRGVLPGEYIVNVHAYSKRMKNKPVPVTVVAEKLNPNVSLIASETVILSKDGEERTAFRFIINKDEEITDVNSKQKILVRGAVGQPQEGFGGGVEGDGSEEGDGVDDNTDYDEF